MTSQVSQRFAKMALALAGAVYVIALVASSSLLPNRVASHFGWSGQADGWMGRTEYTVFMAGVGLGLLALFLSIGWVIRHAPASSINLPQRDYWLAPERRDETSATLGRQFCWLGVMMMVFLLGMHALVIEANRREPHQLSNGIWLWAALLIVAIVIWATVMVRRFSRVPTTAN